MDWIISNKIIDYNLALKEMENIVEGITKGEKNETIWLLEHPKIYTAGTSTKKEHLDMAIRAPVFKTNRGGQLTYHGPGQRIVYLMIDLKRFSYDLKKYVYFLEQLVIDTLLNFNIQTHRWEKAIGVWVYKYNKKNQPNNFKNRCKIASIGIRVRKRISFHGISVNINPSLDYFHCITPCGLDKIKATSTLDLGKKLTFSEFDKALKFNFNYLMKNNSDI